MNPGDLTMRPNPRAKKLPLASTEAAERELTKHTAMYHAGQAHPRWCRDCQRLIEGWQRARREVGQ